MQFEIEWSVGELEWLRAARLRRTERPGSRFDRGLPATGGLLNGVVQMRHRMGLLAPGRPTRDVDGLTTSILDLALQLAGIHGHLAEAPRGRTFVYAERDGYLQIAFRRSGDAVVVTNNYFSSHRLEVPTKDFADGVEDFLEDFVEECGRQVSTLLEWNSLAPLRRFARATPPTAA